MEYRPLGNTGLRVSCLGLGTASFGDLYGRMDDAAAATLVRTALDLGIDLFDTSPYYGQTLAERRLGAALAPVSRDRYSLATKCGRYGVQDFDFSPVRIRRSLDESLGRLGVEHLDLFQLHDVEFGDLDRICGESIPALVDLRQAGKVRAIGVTGLPLLALQRCAATGLLDTVLSYCHHTLCDTTLRDWLPAWQEQGLGVLNGSPLAMGLLSPQGPPDWHPAPEEVREHCRRAADYCRRRQADLAALAMAFAAADHRIATTLCGSATPDELRTAVAAAGQPVDEALLVEVRTLLHPIRDRTWPQGRPENNP